MEPLRFTGSIDIEAAAGAGKLPRFSMVAHTFQPVRLAGWYHPVIVDAEGLVIPSQARPIRLGHDDAQGVGHTESIRIEDGKLVATGVISRDTAAARDVAGSGRNGFPWQASIGASVEQNQFVKEGASAVVNGQTYPGPLNVARKSTLGEISFVDLGADGDTSASVHAKKKGGQMDPEIIEVETTDVAAERTRVKDIRAAGAGLMRQADTADEARAIEERAIDQGLSVDTARKLFLQLLETSRPSASSAWSGRMGAASDARSQLIASCMLFGGHGTLLAKTIPGGERLASTVTRPSGWPELCARALTLAGHAVPQDRGELIKAAFSTTSLPTAIATSIEKVALTIFLDQSTGWRSVSRIVNASNFRPGAAVRLATGSGFEKVGPGGELKLGSIGENAYTYKVDTYGERYVVTRQALINDDAGILSDIPTIIGNDAAKAISDAFFAVLVANTDLNTDPSSDFFSEARGNLIHADLDFTGLTSAATTLRNRVDDDGRVIGIEPRVLMVPPDLEWTARQLLNSSTLTRDSSSDMQPDGNPLPGLGLTLVVEARLPAGDWFLWGQPMHGAALVALLGGRLGPVVEEIELPGEYLGTGWRGYLDFGISLAEYRTAIKSDVEPYAA